MYQLPAKQAKQFLECAVESKYIALRGLEDYFEDTLTKDERNEAICIRQAVAAAAQLKYAMEMDESGNSTLRFETIFNSLWMYIHDYCKDRARYWLIEITETLQNRFVIEAESEEDAKQIARDLYYDNLLALTAKDLKETTFELAEDE
jgi:hypothetical protein